MTVPALRLEPFRFLIRRDRDGRHRWYLYNASGTVVGMHSSGFPSELEAYQDVELVREELAVAPIVGENWSEGASPRWSKVDGAAGRMHEAGVRDELRLSRLS